MDGESGRLVPFGNGDAFRKEMAGFVGNLPLHHRMSVVATQFAQAKFGYGDRLGDYAKLLQNKRDSQNSSPWGLAL